MKLKPFVIGIDPLDVIAELSEEDLFNLICYIEDFTCNYAFTKRLRDHFDKVLLEDFDDGK